MFSLLSLSALAVALRRARLRQNLRSRRVFLSAAGLAALTLGCVGIEAGDVVQLERCLAYLIMPVGVLWCLGWLATVECLARAEGSRRRAFGATLLFLAGTAAGSAPLGAWAHQQLERPWIAHDPLEEAPFDAVFVHGGGTSVSEDGRLYLTQSGDRSVLAARLYHAGVTPRVVALGAPLPGDAGPPGGDPGEANAALWESLGIPRSAIEVRGRDAWNTSREAREIVREVRARSWRRIGVVSSAWHLARASRHIPDDLRNARGEAVTVVFLAADARGSAPPSGLAAIVPTGAGAAAVQKVAWELLGKALGR